MSVAKSKDESKTTARLATMDRLVKTILPNFLDPVPHRVTLRKLFEAANVPRLKSNPIARRGGGTVYYSVAHVERLLRSRMVV